jgi:ADP-ribose pyrophosphatase
MKTLAKNPSRLPATGASILVLVEGEAVIVKRGKEPSKGLWALPGGKQEFGETLETTARRELLEETGLTAETLQFLKMIEPMRHDDRGIATSHYVLGVFLAKNISGRLVAGDDAAAAEWVCRKRLERYEFTGTSLDILRAHL